MSLLSRIIHAIFDDKRMTEEEVASKLDAAEKERLERLAWRTSIVDLLKLLELPSSMDDRAKLAHELGFGTPAKGFAGSASDNEELRKLVMDKIALKYIKIPK